MNLYKSKTKYLREKEEEKKSGEKYVLAPSTTTHLRFSPLNY
jgi:hypothetical protein